MDIKASGTTLYCGCIYLVKYCKISLNGDMNENFQNMLLLPMNQRGRVVGAGDDSRG